MIIIRDFSLETTQREIERERESGSWRLDVFLFGEKLASSWAKLELWSVCFRKIQIFLGIFIVKVVVQEFSLHP